MTVIFNEKVLENASIDLVKKYKGLNLQQIKDDINSILKVFHLNLGFHKRTFLIK